MAKISKKQKDLLSDQIRQMISDGVYDQDIITHLGITERTFYRYKKKFQTDLIKQWKPDQTKLDYYHSMTLQSLEECYQVNREIMNNTKYSPQAREQSSQTQALARVQLERLEKEGYIPPQNKQLPSGKVIPIEGTEINTQ